MIFFQVPVNYLSLLVCGLVAMIIGYLWYGPLFGKTWLKLIGKKAGEMKAAMTKTYGLVFLAFLVIAWFLEHVIWYAAPGNVTVLIALKTAFYMWLGFVVAVSFIQNLFSPVKKPMNLMLIDNGFYLVVLLAMSLVVVSFR